MDQTIVGLPISNKLPDDWTDGGYHVSPVAAVAVVTAIDSDGDEVHAVLTAEGMTPFQASALLNFGTVYMNEQLRQIFKGNAKNRPSKKK